jgi:hypothetical protein
MPYTPSQRRSSAATSLTAPARQPTRSHFASSRNGALRGGGSHRPSDHLVPAASPSASPDQLYDERQAARLLRVSRRTLQGWRLKGGGPLFVRLGPRCIRYRRADLQDFMVERTARSTSEYDPAG